MGKGLLLLVAVFCVLMALLIWAKSGQAAAAALQPIPNAATLT